MRRPHLPLAGLLFLTMLLVVGTPPAAVTQGRITSPKEQFGFNIGDDYSLANFTQLTDYWRKLDAESDRLTVVEIGKTAEGRTMLMGIITSPENHRKLDRYKEIARRLALAEGLTDDEARALAAEGRAVVWIDGGLHATEVLGAQQIIETVYQLVSRTDQETLRFLSDDIVLCTLVNPDGMELVSNWYMRNPDPMRRSMAGVPRLYQKYVGHDNNRDFYMSAQPESEAINKVFYREWFPQIVYNHHQSGPAGTVLFAPPFRDPFNYNYDPLIPLGIDLVGAAMHNRFAAEGKPGATMRRGASYSTWWNGGLRTTVYFHNMIGLLTESIGSPTPMEIPFVPDNQLPRGDLPYPIAPQKWHFRQSIEYSITANRAVLDVASRHREQFLFNIYQMGRNSIQRGSRDSWTIHGRRVDEVKEAIARDAQSQAPQGGGRGAAFARASAPTKYYDLLRRPVDRDPRGYILRSDQPDFLTARKFIEALLENGVTVHRATAAFQANGKSFPPGSFVVKTAQAFRPHVLDMFEPQFHPDDIPFPGGPPTPPYDNAGYTLAYQMGVEFERVLDGFDGPFERVSLPLAPEPGKVTQVARAAGYVLDHRVNDAAIVVNRLLKSGEEVSWVKGPVTAGGRTLPAGAIFVAARPTTLATLQKAGALGVSAEAVAARPAGELMRVRPARVGLWDRYGGSMPSGWIRWLLEQYEFPFEVVYPKTLDAGNLSARFDVLIFPDGAIPERDGAGGDGGGGGQMPREVDIPAEFRDWLGNVTVKTTVPHLRKFLEDGGTIVTIGTSTILGQHLALPIASALVERSPGAAPRPLPREKFYVPGSVLEAAVDTTAPAAYGASETVNVFYDNSPAFRLGPGAGLKGVRPIAWFASATPLRSGWAWGQTYLDGAVAMAEAAVGKGRLFLFGPEITFRGQPHGTFKFLFNAIHHGSAAGTRAEPTAAGAQGR
jgi:hypothetical protein